LSEGLVRIFLPHWAPRTAEISGFWAHDSSLGWSHIPNAKGPFNVLGHETLISINSKGFRDVERSYERDISRYRIVVLGDSMVWGYGVQQEDVFTALLEKRLQGVEAINLGVSGYGTDQELILLQREGVRYRPNLFIVVIAYNDLQTNVQTRAYLAYQKPMFEFSRNGGLSLTNTPVPRQTFLERGALTLIRYSFVLNKAASMYHYFTLGSVSRGLTAADVTKEQPFPRSAAEQITVAMLLEMGVTARQVNADLLLVLADGMGQIGREMEKFFGARNIRILNMDQYFSKEDVEGFHLRDGMHWNPGGHRNVADRLARYLEDQKLIR
jgi:lysophospholipase L1-like esterase